MILVFTVVGIKGEGKMLFACEITDEMPFGVRTASSSGWSVMNLFSSGVDKLKMGVTRLGTGWPHLGILGLLKSKDKSRFVFSMLLMLILLGYFLQINASIPVDSIILSLLMFEL